MFKFQLFSLIMEYYIKKVNLYTLYKMLNKLYVQNMFPMCTCQSVLVNIIIMS